jgi:transglutaminase-like putative cysteine protease
MEAKTSPIRWWDLPAALLLLAALSTAATRLVATHWTRHLEIVQTLAFFGALLGLALGKSRFSPRLVAFLAIAYGAFAVPQQLGSFLRDDIQWLERLNILANRLGVIIYQIANHETVQDSLLFLVSMAIMFWALSVLAGYTLVRYGNGWPAILPAGLAMFVIHSFDALLSRRAWYLAIYLFFALVLVARTTFLQQQNRWQNDRTALPPHLGLDFIRFTIFTTFLIVLFAWTVPALANAVPAAQEAWQPVRRVWDEARDRFDNIFASLRPSVLPVSQFYGSSALLGHGSQLSDSQIFQVKPPAGMPVSLRMYWRARTYETYNDGQWLSTVTSNYAFNPDEGDLYAPTWQGRWLGSFDFTSSVNMTTLFTPSQPLWLSRPGQIEYAVNPDSSVDIAAFRAVPSIEPGQEYQVQASINYASVARLEQAGTDYPAWVTERYLSLPDSITPRTRQLADEITAGLETPYDKALAITDYLRRNITYVETIQETQPQGQETIDWFLFDLKQGFCNYYSTAEVVLLRAVGIPARWAVGYAQGERVASDISSAAQPANLQIEETYFLVRQRDAHAWPEVYFPSAGWVEFEPTTSQPEIIRLENDPETMTNDPSSSASDAERLRREHEEELAMLREGGSGLTDSTPQQNRMIVVYWSASFVLVSGLFFLIWRFRERIHLPPTPILLEMTFQRLGITPPQTVRLWARHASLPPLAKAYVEINRALSRLDAAPAVTATPAERAAKLGAIMPPAEKPAQRLVNEYQRGVFSLQPPNLAIALGAAADIKAMSFKTFLQRILSRLQRPSKITGQPLHRGKYL